MSNRSERREADRASHKAASQARRQQPEPALTPVAVMPEVVPQAVPEPLKAIEYSQISDAQWVANRANARRSAGATTEAGKAKSSMNALKHGLTGKTVLLPTDDADEYNRILNAYVDSYKPAAEEELRLIQSLVDSAWRLQRCRILETGILIKGAAEFASKYEDHSPVPRAQLIHVDAYLKYEKSIRNLQIQEARLHRRLEKDQAELVRLQSTRKREELLAAQQPANPPVHPNGFEFSTPASHPPATPIWVCASSEPRP